MATSEGYLEEINVELGRALGRPRSVLDIGCGRGQNGELARAKGAHVVGVEGWAPAAAAARERLDEVIEADVESDGASAALGSRRFDLILFGDVLEHTRDPKAVLDRFIPFLDDGGRVIVSLPNVAAWTVRLGLLAGEFEYAQSGILDKTHLRFFTRDTATRLVQQAGLELLWVGLNPMLVRAGLGTIRKVLVRDGAGGGDPADLRNNPLYQTYLKVVRPVEGQIARLAPGMLSFQTVVVARKPPVRRKLTCTVGMLSMNEEKAVGRVIDEIRGYAPDAEILLVDSSTDRTADIAQEKGARVIRQVPPRGYGPAMDALLYGATGDVVITMDCDGTYPADRIPALRTLVEEGADLVNGSRTRHRPVSMPFPNFLANRVFATAANLAHGLDTMDVHSGMRAYRASMLRAIDIDPKGQALPVELLVVPARDGFRVVDIEIPYDHRVGVSTLNRWQSTLWTFRRLARGAPGPRVRRNRWTKL